MLGALLLLALLCFVSVASKPLHMLAVVCHTLPQLLSELADTISVDFVALKYCVQGQRHLNVQALPTLTDVGLTWTALVATL